MNSSKWVLEEDMWNEKFSWFLVDEGEIQYSFKNEADALSFKKQFNLGFMFLTNLGSIVEETMLEPHEFRSWSRKIQITVQHKIN
jgi:hypothetical protein